MPKLIRKAAKKKKAGKLLTPKKRTAKNKQLSVKLSKRKSMAPKKVIQTKKKMSVTKLKEALQTPMETPQTRAVNPDAVIDPAHAHGHRRLNLNY